MCSDVHSRTSTISLKLKHSILALWCHTSAPPSSLGAILNPCCPTFHPASCESLGKSNKRWCNWLDPCNPRGRIRRTFWFLVLSWLLWSCGVWSNRWKNLCVSLSLCVTLTLKYINKSLKRKHAHVILSYVVLSQSRKSRSRLSRNACPNKFANSGS